MNLKEAERYYIKLIEELEEDCRKVTPWVFVCAATYIDYLSRLTYGRDRGGPGYISFIRNYLSQVQPAYRDFVFKNGKNDLPEQMWYILRCGIVHNFSFVPSTKSKKNDGRLRSINLRHQKEAKANGWTHLMHFRTSNVSDAALFIAEEFVSDLKKVSKFLFEKARSNHALRTNMTSWLKTHPPISPKF